MNHLHFVFLRAVNTGTRRLTNDELLAPLIDAGFDDVAAFQAAGNIVFRSEADVDPDAISTMLTAAYGFDTPVFVRSESELGAVVDRCPFTDEQLEATAGRVQVTFLRSPPTAQQIAEIVPITPAEDLVEFDGSEWYWLPVDGVSTSTLPVAKIEQIVGPMSMRTLGTAERMLKKFAD